MKTTKKMSKLLAVGLLGLVLAFGVTLVGCDDGSKDEDPPNPTIKLTDTGANTFTLTLTETEWYDIGGNYTYLNAAVRNALSESNTSGFISGFWDLNCSYTKTSDTVLEVVASKWSGETAAGSITLALKSDVSSLDHYIPHAVDLYPVVVASDSGSVTITFPADS